jgi:predicted dehydrogenase/acetyltransferase-like isoleucine patch superfamily enzyme
MPDAMKPLPAIHERAEATSARVAVLGCGYWGRHLVRNFHGLGALAAVCDPDSATASAMAEKHGVPARSVEAVLADPAIAAVVIAAPAELHAALVRRALEAGKHVFVEKPLALTLTEGEELVRFAEARGRLLMVGHLLQYHPVFERLKQFVREGRLGRLQYIYSNRLNLGKVRREENILWSFAPHDISMILALCGEPPTDVSAVGASYLHEVIADVTTTHLTFASGIRAHLFVSWLHPFKEQKLVVVGEDGMAVFDDGQPWERKLLVYPHRVQWIDGRPEPSKAEAEPVPVEPAEPLARECAHFLDCVATGRRPRTDGEEGLRVLAVLQAAQRSMDERRAVASPAPRGAGKDGPATRHPGVKVHETAVIDEPVEIGAGTRIWHFSHVLAGVRIGRDCVIGQNAMIGPDVVVGDRCKIQNNVSLYKGVTLEDGVFCGPSAVFTNVLYVRAEIERKDEFRPTLVRRGATIGANATIVCGATLGAYCFVAAGAVVTDDVPAHALVAGVPARRIGWVSHAGERLGSDLVCPREGRRYRVADGNRLEEI